MFQQKKEVAALNNDMKALNKKIAQLKKKEKNIKAEIAKKKKETEALQAKIKKIIEEEIARRRADATINTQLAESFEKKQRQAAMAGCDRHCHQEIRQQPASDTAKGGGF